MQKDFNPFLKASYEGNVFVIYYTTNWPLQGKKFHTLYRFFCQQVWFGPESGTADLVESGSDQIRIHNEVWVEWDSIYFVSSRERLLLLQDMAEWVWVEMNKQYYPFKLGCMRIKKGGGNWIPVHCAVYKRNRISYVANL